MRNFLIISMGRSGTKFLATNMNKSKQWIVEHEGIRRLGLRRTSEDIQKFFNKDFYGDVDGLLRYIADQIKVEKKGVILRDPEELWFSNATRYSQPPWKNKKVKMWMKSFDNIKKTIPHILNLAESGRYYIIDFKRMVSDKDYLKDIFLHFGIDDVKITKTMLKTKINNTPENIKRTTWADFNPGIRNKIMQLKEIYLKRTEKIFGE